MLMKAEQSVLLLIDVQEKLTPLVYEYEKLIENCTWLIRLADVMKVPVLISEQYPKGLGHTIATLQTLISDKLCMEKIHFSCAADPICMQHIADTRRKQIIVIGIEAHVCVLQTVLELAEEGKQIFVVSDAIASRNYEDKLIALQRMRKAGIEIVTHEMVLFEWLRQAGTDLFRSVSKEFLK